MDSIISALRSVLGEPSFYINNELNYGYVVEYVIAGVLLLVVVSSVFKFLNKAAFR